VPITWIWFSRTEDVTGLVEHPDAQTQMGSTSSSQIFDSTDDTRFVHPYTPALALKGVLDGILILSYGKVHA
jgi:hypothetical protein